MSEKTQNQISRFNPASFTPGTGGILQRACACGNHTVAGGECAECEKKKNSLQRKLVIGASNDPLEREADRVADQVMAAPAPSPVSGTPPRIQRFTGQPTGQMDSVPASVDQALANPGRPLVPSLRQDMEQRFGYDFSRVRVHADAKAAESARAVNALAYTVGRDVVFGAGQYMPETKGGKRLLAHELAHLVQQSGAESALCRKPDSTTVEVNVPANVCSPQQTREIGPAVATAQQWLRIADTRLTAYLGGIGTPAQRTEVLRRTALSLRRHFAASNDDTARYVQNQIRLIADRLRTDPNAPSALTVSCHDSSDTSCGAAAAYVLGAALVFCPSFFGSDPAWRVMAVIHEIAHSLAPATGPLHITDRAYRGERLYGSLTPGEALTNAESYAMIVRELATGLISGNAPRDTYEDCPTHWRRALAIAIALAQRWNRDAQVVLSDRRPAFLAAWSALATTQLGGQSPAQLGSAQAVYDQAAARLQSRVDFECETEGGGRCDTNLTYWYALGDFHICPSWLARSTDEDRAQALLAGLYGYFRIVEDNNRRWNLARLAHALHSQWWAPPSATDISRALTGTRTGPRPPAAPSQGPPPPH